MAKEIDGSVEAPPEAWAFVAAFLHFAAAVVRRFHRAPTVRVSRGRLETREPGWIGVRTTVFESFPRFSVSDREGFLDPPRRLELRHGEECVVLGNTIEADEVDWLAKAARRAFDGEDSEPQEGQAPSTPGNF